MEHSDEIVCRGLRLGIPPLAQRDTQSLLFRSSISAVHVVFFMRRNLPR